MSSTDKAVQTQLRNIEARTGKTLDELCAMLRQSGLERHGELRDLLQRDLGMGYGDANIVVHLFSKKQFATIGPATNARVDLGLNMKDVAPTSRLVALPAGGMCQYKVALTDPQQVDAELLGWVRRAYDAAG